MHSWLLLLFLFNDGVVDVVAVVAVVDVVAVVAVVDVVAVVAVVDNG